MKPPTVVEGQTLTLRRMKRRSLPWSTPDAVALVTWRRTNVETREGTADAFRPAKKSTFATREEAAAFAQEFVDRCIAKGLRPPPPPADWLTASQPAPEEKPPRGAPFRGKKPMLLGAVSSQTSLLELMLLDASSVPDEDDERWERRFPVRKGATVGGQTPVGASLSALVGGVGVAYAFRAGASIVLVEGPNKHEVTDGDVLRFVVADLGKNARPVGEVDVTSGVLAIVTGNETEADRRKLVRKARLLKRGAAEVDTQHGTTSILVTIPKGRRRVTRETLSKSAIGKLARLVIH